MEKTDDKGIETGTENRKIQGRNLQKTNGKMRKQEEKEATERHQF